MLFNFYFFNFVRFSFNMC